MGRRPEATRKQEILALQPLVVNPCRHRVARLLGDFELDGPLRLLLHHNRAGRDPFAVHDVPDAKLDEVARPQLTIHNEVE